ncbi:MAG: translin family protein [Thermoplasmata archaeon]|nr:translin family protein [Thermoplasmata archaeon]
MKNLDRVVSKIEVELDEKDQIREVALKSSRVIVRLSGNIVRGLHKKIERVAEMDALKDEVSNLSSLLREHPELEHTGYVENAFQEYAEVNIIMSLLEKSDVPSPDDMNIGSVPYLLALGDSIGELRRFCLDELKSGKVAKANKYLEMMEDLFTALIRFDYPEAIVPLRHKQDVARSLLEKTRGEVAVAASTRNLHERLDEVLRKK